MIPAYITGRMPTRPPGPDANPAPASAPPPLLARDPEAKTRYYEPRQNALDAFDQTLKQFDLDGYVYPAIQMPPNDELADLAEGHQSQGPHSETAWANPIGIPAVVVPGGFYDSGLPFGIEFSTSRWRDGDLLGWAFAYEQATRHRRAPRLMTAR
jgi:Asp-tRNA(Asn)/Glu-tRNA(Gln) amidotransferase A subunit family amidase